MKKYVSFDKLSKRKQKELNRQKRGSWNGVKPVTRRVESKKVYNRKKSPFGKDDFPNGDFSILRFSPYILCILSVSARIM